MRGAVAAGLLLAALVPAACGGDGPPSSGVPGNIVPPGTGTPPTTPTEPSTPSSLNIILGRPTDTSIAASVLGDAGTDVSFEYGTASGSYASQTPVLTTSAGGPTAIEFTNLTPNTRYHYRARYRPVSESNHRADVERSFHTQRRPGSTFSFGLLGGGSSLFLVNGNHEQAAGYLLGDRYSTPYRDAPVFAGRARVTYFPLPAPDGFYGGDTMQVPGVGSSATTTLSSGETRCSWSSTRTGIHPCRRTIRTRPSTRTRTIRSQSACPAQAMTPRTA
jgi:hypothetical protein